MSNLQSPYTLTLVAGADLRSNVNRFVTLDANKRVVLGTAPASMSTQGAPIGVLNYPANSGQPVGVAYAGQVDVYTATSLGIGDFVTCNSVGGAKVAGSGDVVRAYAWQAAVPGALAPIELCPPFRLSTAGG